MLSYWLYSLVFFSHGKIFKFKLVQLKKNTIKNTPPPPKKKLEIEGKKPNQNTPPPKKKTPHVKIAVYTCIASGIIHVHISYSQFVVKKKNLIILVHAQKF